MLSPFIIKALPIIIQGFGASLAPDLKHKTDTFGGEYKIRTYDPSVNSRLRYRYANSPNLCADYEARTLLIFYLLDSNDPRRPFVISNDAIRVIAGLWYPVPDSNWCLENENLKC